MASQVTKAVFWGGYGWFCASYEWFWAGYGWFCVVISGYWMVMGGSRLVMSGYEWFWVVIRGYWWLRVFFIDDGWLRGGYGWF